MHVIYFLDGPEAGTVRRVPEDPGRAWRVSQLPGDLQARAAWMPPCPDNVFSTVITYALFKLPEGWPSRYWRDTEYVAKVMR